MAHGKQAFHTSTVPGKAKGPVQQQTGGSQGRVPLPTGQSNTLPLPPKQETPPAATVRPFTPDLPAAKDANGQLLQKPQSGAASYIYKMYVGEGAQQGVQAALSRSQNRNNFVSGKPTFMLFHFPTLKYIYLSMYLFRPKSPNQSPSPTVVPYTHTHHSNPANFTILPFLTLSPSPKKEIRL